MNDEREFLLRSLADLEREYEAGDLEESDYTVLRDDYIARAATALRSEDGRLNGAAEPGGDRAPAAATAFANGGRRRPPRGRTFGVGTAVLAAAIGLGVLVARGSGERLPGQTITGDIPELARATAALPTGCPAKLTTPTPPKPRPPNPRQADIDKLLSDGQTHLGTDLLAAIKAFDGSIAIDPKQVTALTYSGWIRRIVVSRGGPADLLDRAQELLNRAIAADPTFPDARAFRGVLLLRDRDDPKAALIDLCTLLLLDTPTQVQQLAAPALQDALSAVSPSPP